MLAHNVSLAYPNPKEPFHIKTDASDYQLGAMLKQNGHPVAFFSCKLMGDQRNYTTIQKELLSVIETLTTFCSILLGFRIHIWTDHANLTCKNLTSQQVLCWQQWELDCQTSAK
jgi:hypothetical protein